MNSDRIYKSTRCIFLVIVFWCLLITPIFPEPIIPYPNWGKTSYLLYGGPYSSTDLLPIVLRAKTDYKDSNIAVFGASVPLETNIRFINFEAELNVGKHWGLMNHYETNGLVMARIPNLFGIPLSFAMGEGLSLASENPKLENQKKGFFFNDIYTDYFTGSLLLANQPDLFLITKIQNDTIESRNLLNFISMELDYGFPKWESFPRIFMRIHHRSGVFGLYCPPDPACGSNFVTYGFKFHLN